MCRNALTRSHLTRVPMLDRMSARIVQKCAHCPFSGDRSAMTEHQCSKSGRVIDMDDYTLLQQQFQRHVVEARSTIMRLARAVGSTTSADASLLGVKQSSWFAVGEASFTSVARKDNLQCELFRSPEGNVSLWMKNVAAADDAADEYAGNQNATLTLKLLHPTTPANDVRFSCGFPPASLERNKRDLVEPSWMSMTELQGYVLDGKICVGLV